MSLLVAENISFRYGSQSVLERVSFAVQAGEFVSVLGPSGCGKSTLLHLLSGLKLPQTGSVRFRNEIVQAPSRRRAMIFQGHALFPWATARDNVRFAMNSSQDPDFFLAQVGLQSHAAHFPHQLSGGQQQRVGIARALAADGDVLLLDEPFASLDTLRRQTLSVELLRLARKFGKAMVFVTHNVDEAIFLGDRVYLLSPGPGRIVGEIDTRGSAKPDSLIKFKITADFSRFEREIYAQMAMDIS